MSKLAHSDDEGMARIDLIRAAENGDLVEVGVLLEYDGIYDSGYRFVKTGDPLRAGWLNGATQRQVFALSSPNHPLNLEEKACEQ